MTGDERPGLPAAFAALAALVAGVVVMIGFALADDAVARVLIAVATAALGLVVFAVARGAVGAAAARGIGTGLVVLGAQLLGAGILVGGRLGPGEESLVVLLGYGLPALVMLALGAIGMRVWLAGAGILVPTVVVLMVRMMSGTPEPGVLVAATVLTVVVVMAPADAQWGDLAGVAAATCAVHIASGAYLLLAFATVNLPAQGGVIWSLGQGWQVLYSVGAVVVAAVLLAVATVRRDLATGLVAAVVLVLGSGPGQPFVWVPLVVFVLALVAVPLSGLRAVLARGVAALRDHGTASTAAGCATLAGVALVAFAWRGLPSLELSRWLTGLLTLLALLIAGALAHFLPTPAGAPLAAVTLVALLLTGPWWLMLGDDLVVRVTGTVGLVQLVTVIVAVWVLTQRHNTPAVWAAGAYLTLGTLPDVIGPLLGQDPTAQAVTLLLPLLVIGVPAAVLALIHPATRRWQAIGATVVGSTIALPAFLSLVQTMARDADFFGASVNPLVPVDAWSSTRFLDADAATAVVVTVILLALASVVSVARRPSTPLAVTVALALFTAVPLAARRLVTRPDADIGVFLVALGVTVVALVFAALFAARRHAFAEPPVHGA